MLFFIVDIIVFVMYLNFKNKVDELQAQENIDEKLLAFYEKKKNDYFMWLMWCMVINGIFFLW